MGGATVARRVFILSISFQSTLPVGGATRPSNKQRQQRVVSIHASRGGSDGGCCPGWWHCCVSIHASRGGSDKVLYHQHLEYMFQSTLPVGGATSSQRYQTHPTRGGFNPRFPWGERLRKRVRVYRDNLFQSTLPVGGATDVAVAAFRHRHCFNPRFPWGERLVWSVLMALSQAFQSTLPVGGATDNLVAAVDPAGFQSTLPVGGATG